MEKAELVARDPALKRAQDRERLLVQEKSVPMHGGIKTREISNQGRPSRVALKGDRVCLSKLFPIAFHTRPAAAAD